MIKFEKIKPGMVLYDVRPSKRWRGGKWATWPVHVLEVDTEKRLVRASWNSNASEWMPERRITKYRATKPKE